MFNMCRDFDIYRMIVQEIDEGVIIIDTKGIIKFVNPSTTKMTGYTKEELFGKYWKVILDNESTIPKDLGLQLMGTKNEHIVISFETFLKVKNNEKTPVTLKIQPIINKESGSVIEKLIVITEISRLKMTEQELNDKKKESEFYLYLLTHDLLNFQHSKMPYLEYIMNGLEDSELEEMVKTVIKLEAKTNTLLRNINVLMKKNISLRNYKLRPMNLVSILRTTNESVRYLFPERKIDIDFQQIPDDFEILADSLIEQLFLNLLTNSIKYSPKGQTARVIIQGEQLGPNICSIRVIDHGKGIPADKREKLFIEPFVQFRKKGRGSGLGLYIAKTIVDRYGGKIWVDGVDPEDYTKGTVVNILLKTPHSNE